MSIVNCLDCGKIMIPRYREYLCPDCELDQKEKAFMIKAYIFKNPHATRMDVYMEMGIPLHIIDRLF